MASTVGWAASPSAVLQEVRTYKVTRMMLTRCLASVFFVTYETLKTQLSKALYPESASNAVGESPAVHMMAGSAAEVAACMIRVPTEVVKSRQQTSAYGRVSTFRALQLAASEEGIRGLYRGFFSTILREIPFTCIQFPLFEFLKRQMAKHTPTLSGARRQDAAWWQSALSGSIAGSIAAALTTPLDVIKTRIMLARARSESASTAADAARAKQDTRILTILRTVVQQGGVRGLFAGVVPRTMWIGLGGAVFLGTFDAAAKTLQPSPAVKIAETSRT